MNKFNKNFYKKRTFIIFSAAVLFFIVYSFQFYNILSLPKQIDIYIGECKNLNISFPFTVDIDENKEKLLKVNDSEGKIENFFYKNKLKLKSIGNGVSNIQLKFLGLVPIKKVKVNMINRVHLIPGGDAIGVKLNTKGVLIVALSEITDSNGQKKSPAKEAGLKEGDVILEINNEKIRDTNHIIEMLNYLKNEKVDILIERNGNIFSSEIKPIKSIEDDYYRLGLWVRDKTAGIGTLTFYDKETNIYGALGHGITDLDTGKLMPVGNGEIIKAKVTSIDQGKKGEPGELKGVFVNPEKKIGNVTKNTDYGIYGEAKTNNEMFEDREALPIATQDEVREGKAYILTTIEDNIIKKYDIEIIKKSNQIKQSQKSLIIKVTDKELLSKTGGIVQGMSGSPIIQDGKIVGAVTHVFVNDPSKGYGLYVEWMLKEAGLNISNKKEFANAE